MTDNEIIKALKELLEIMLCEGDLQRASTISNTIDLIKRKEEEKEDLEYVLMAVMHSVDKWLEGDELKQDEANRACTMREKTLKITEKLHKQIDGLKQANQEQCVAIEKRKAEIERLSKKYDKLAKEQYDLCGYIVDLKDDLKIAKTEAYREFAERLKGYGQPVISGTDTYDVMVSGAIINALAKELTESK